MTAFAIFDLDGTIRDTHHYRYPRAHQVKVFPGIVERLLVLKRAGYVLVGATNQAGVSQGVITPAEVEEAICETQRQLGDARLDEVFYCAHYMAQDGRACDCKKPAPGMVLKALSRFPGISLSGSFVVGDNHDADGGMARSLGLPFLPIDNFLSTAPKEILRRVGELVEVVARVDAPEDRIAGTLLGLAVADALGAPLEFHHRSMVRRMFPSPLREMIASARWEAGEFTDDTDMALMVASGYGAQDRQGRLQDPLQRMSAYFQAWAKSGLQLEAGPFLPCKDIGIASSAVIRAGATPAAAQAYYARHPQSSAGNGAVMRCAPVAIRYLNDLPMLLADSRRTALLTHADPKALSSCVILNVWIREILQTGNKDGRKKALSFVPKNELAPWHRLETIHFFPEDAIQSTGFTVHTLEAAAWSFLTTDNFEEAVVRAANLGHDADTVAAVTGALAGAFYGESGIPKRWLEKLKGAEQIRAIALRTAALEPQFGVATGVSSLT